MKSDSLSGRSKPETGLAFPPKRYDPMYVNQMFHVIQHMTPRTIKQVFDSTDNYSMPTKFPQIGIYRENQTARRAFIYE